MAKDLPSQHKTGQGSIFSTSLPLLLAFWGGIFFVQNLSITKLPLATELQAFR
jgi:hypothetical protein